MSEKKSDERRGTERIGASLDVDFSTYSSYHLRRITNISVGGAFIKTPKPLPVGTELEIHFKLPHLKRKIMSKVKVCWTYRQPEHVNMNSTGMGVEFLDIDSEDLKAIQDYINTQAEERDGKQTKT